jgi:HK97 family phage prohead protease
MRGTEIKSKKDLNAELNEQGIFEGILASYNNIDYGGDLIEPGAFTKTIAETGGSVPLLWQHNSEEPIGRLTLQDTSDALRVKGFIDLDTQSGREAYSRLKKKVINGLSIGYDTIKSAFDGPVRRLKELRLWEGSIVTFPMDTRAIVLEVKAARERKDDFATELAERQLAAAGYQMMSSIEESLYETVFDMTMTAADKVAAARMSIQQFSDAFLNWLPEYLSYMAEQYGGNYKAIEQRARERKEGRMISDANRQTLKAAHSQIVDAAEKIRPLWEEAGLENSTTSGTKAGRESKPADDHLAATLERMRALIRVA